MDIRFISRLCVPERNIFIMRDHNHAFGAWEIVHHFGIIRSQSTLVHVDGHFDDCLPSSVIDERLRQVSKIEDSLALANDMYKAEFIMPAVYRGIFKRVIYVCTEKRDYSVDYIMTTDMFKEFMSGRPYEPCYFPNVFEFQRYFNLNGIESNGHYALDLDLDYFNNGTKWGSDPVLPSEDEIIETLEILRSIIPWKVITVAMEPDYCGGDEACGYLFDLFLKVFEIDIMKAIQW